MKKLYLLFCLTLFGVSVFAADFKVIKDTKAVIDRSDELITIKKNTTVQIEHFYMYEPGNRYSKALGCEWACEIKYDGKIYKINVDDLIPAEAKKGFDENIITHKVNTKNKHWTSLLTLEILKSNTRDNYFKMHQKSLEAYSAYFPIDQWMNFVNFKDLIINNQFIILNDDRKYGLFYFVKNIEIKKNEYIIKAELGYTSIDQYINDYQNEKLEKLLTQKEVTFRAVRDGDYLHFYTSDNELVYTAILVDETVPSEFMSLIKSNKCNQTAIKWPKHADQSCDYDGSSKFAINRTMITFENLNLRKGDSRSNPSIAVLAAGTKIKILELGKAEQIDGIDSNWVKVEILDGTKDRNGNPIKSGTTGWCFGGYIK